MRWFLYRFIIFILFHATYVDTSLCNQEEMLGYACVLSWNEIRLVDRFGRDSELPTATTRYL